MPTKTTPPWAVISSILTDGLFKNITVQLPFTIEPGGPIQMVKSPITDPGATPPIITVGAPGPTIGPPTCGIGIINGVNIGQSCMPIKIGAAGNIKVILLAYIKTIDLDNNHLKDSLITKFFFKKNYADY